MKQRLQAIIIKIKSLPRIYKAVFIITIVALIAALLVIGNSLKAHGDTVEKEKDAKKHIKIVRILTINGKTVEAELASTPQERMRGLMYRTELADGKGMLFTFGAEGSYPFWMKNMQIPIDIIWLNAGLNIVDIDINVPVCAQQNCELYTPNAPAKYVLEVPSGWTGKNNVKAGDKMEMGASNLITQ